MTKIWSKVSHLDSSSDTPGNREGANQSDIPPSPQYHTTILWTDGNVESETAGRASLELDNLS